MENDFSDKLISLQSNKIEDEENDITNYCKKSSPIILCEICQQNQFKYKCPGCLIKNTKRKKYAAV